MLKDGTNVWLGTVPVLLLDLSFMVVKTLLPQIWALRFSKTIQNKFNIFYLKYTNEIVHTTLINSNIPN
jgi:hypothetical protein